MLVSCLCVCHNKPDFTQEAIRSIINQRYPHWEALVIDSGVLYDAGYYDRFPWRHDPRVTLIRSAETDAIRRTKAMAPWCYNECLRRGLVSGDLIMYLCDDDILYPDAFATFVAYCRRNPDAQAMYASQDVAVIYPNGWRAIVGERRATEPGGTRCQGRRMDCHVDYLQFCHKAEVLQLLPSTEYWPEGKDTESHADGLFMERIGEHVTIFPIDVKVSQNRRTPHSTYVPIGSFALVDCMANGVPLSAARSTSDHRSPEALLRPTPAPRPTAMLEDAPLVTVSITFNRSDSLPDLLASVAAQTYPNLEVLVIDRCSTDCASAKVLETMQSRYPQFRFLPQTCVENRSLRDRGLWEARGVYFIPLHGDTLARSDMVERLVMAMRHKPGLSAMTCYVLEAAGTKHLYGSGIFDVARFRQVGGYGTEQEISGQDWIGFLRLVNAGYHVDILPEHLFYSRPRQHGSVRSQDDLLGEEHVLQQFFRADRQLAAERIALWTAFAGMQDRLKEVQRRLDELAEQNQALRIRCASFRYQMADRLTMLCDRVPFAKRSLQWLLALKKQNVQGAP